MSLQNDLKLYESIKLKEQLQVVRINWETTKRHKDPTFFFRDLKNGLSSIGGKTNRSFFKGISGMYVSLHKNNKIDLYLLYETNEKVLHELQLKMRIKKMLGSTTEIEIGDLNRFKDEIEDILGFNRVVQSFGDFYYNSRVLGG
jgi:hypothetical protein